MERCKNSVRTSIAHHLPLIIISFIDDYFLVPANRIGTDTEPCKGDFLFNYCFQLILLSVFGM